MDIHSELLKIGYVIVDPESLIPFLSNYSSSIQALKKIHEKLKEKFSESPIHILKEGDDWMVIKVITPKSSTEAVECMKEINDIWNDKSWEDAGGLSKDHVVINVDFQ